MPGPVLSEVRLYLIDDDSSRRMTVGRRQAEWLEREGYIELHGYEQTSQATGIAYYRAKDGRTVDELNELTLSVDELLECDFCPVHPAPTQATHRINVRRTIEVDLAGANRAPLNRPVYACDACARLVEAGAKHELTERVLTAWEKVGLERNVLPHQTREVAGPQVIPFIRAVFANRKGRPEPIVKA